MKNYAEEEKLLSQPQKMLISSLTLQNGTFIAPLLSFYLQLGLVCTKIHRFAEYTPKKGFNSFCAASSGRKKARRRKPKLKCGRRNIETSSQQLLRLPDHGREPTRGTKVPR